eukprot:GHVL01030969.1.p1 GENE.GHVL01030969.1~~GHVL01030969.1.p1  ORF type:complete len:275 (+),score=48.04 GHVL01030969.1:263-1087(+)
MLALPQSEHPVKPKGFAVQSYKSAEVEVFTVPLNSDNYGYLIAHPMSKECMAVDPAGRGPNPEVVMKAAEDCGFKITTVLTTHWHADHAGGNAYMAQHIPNLMIRGPSGETSPIPGLTHPVKDNDYWKFHSIEIRAIKTPCHTKQHTMFFVSCEGDKKAKFLFSGDNLMVGGCGRFFEGNEHDMLNNMKRTKELSDETMIFCGHEYTVNNLKFAMTVEPNNQRISDKLIWARDQISKSKPTIPSTIGDEKLTNVFMRCEDSNRLKTIRAEKDAF